LFIVILAIFCLIMLLFRLRKEAVINKNGAYVIGVVISRDWRENGHAYKFKYFYNGRSYIAELTDIRKASDSFAFFKISREYPDKWKYIEFKKVPECFLISSVPKFGWRDLPTCDSLKASSKRSKY
jgi:hypothetical protein